MTIHITEFSLLLDIDFPPQTVTVFPVPIPGPRTKDGEWEKIGTKQDIPTYSIVNIQQVYRSFPENQFLVPLFLQLPEAPFSARDNYHTVTAVDQDRLDLISYHFYDTVEYVWIILLANTITDPFSIPIGTILRIPSPETIVIDWLSDIGRRPA